MPESAAARPGAGHDTAPILVTGANGFVARAVCKRLTATNRPWLGVARELPQGSVDGASVVAVGDYAHVDWQPLFRDIDCVVHVAALTEPARGQPQPGAADYLLANRDVTRRLAEAAVAASVRRIVLVSSIKVCGESTPRGQPFSVNAPHSPSGAYAQSKAAGEEVLWSALRHTRTEGVVLRPTIVYGPGARGNFAALVNAIVHGWPLPLRSIDNRRSMLYVHNAAAAIEAAVDRPPLAGRSWPVADLECVSTSELAVVIAQCLNRRTRLFHVPRPLFHFLARAARKPGIATRLFDSLEVDAAAFWTAAALRPPYTQRAAFAETIAKWQS
jgi:nucleoside-diphosphate-sugar epimerase